MASVWPTLKYRRPVKPPVIVATIPFESIQSTSLRGSSVTETSQNRALGVKFRY